MSECAKQTAEHTLTYVCMVICAPYCPARCLYPYIWSYVSCMSMFMYTNSAQDNEHSNGRSRGEAQSLGPRARRSRRVLSGGEGDGEEAEMQTSGSGGRGWPSRQQVAEIGFLKVPRPCERLCSYIWYMTHIHIYNMAVLPLTSHCLHIHHSCIRYGCSDKLNTVEIFYSRRA